MANGFADIGLGLQGFSAGLGGRGIEFNKQLRQTREDAIAAKERSKVAETERLKTQFTDSSAALTLANQGNWTAVLNLAQNREALLNSNFPNVDSKDTKQAVALAMSAADGNAEAQQLLTDTLQNTVDVGIARQILPKPESDLVASSDITDGFIIQNLGKGKFKKTRVIDESELGGSNASLELRRELLKDLSSDNIQTRNSAAVSLGLKGRASGAAPQVIMIGGVPHIFDQQSKSVVPVEVSGQEVTPEDVAKTEQTISEGRAKGTAKGKAGVELVARPMIEKAVKLAIGEAKAETDQFAENRSNNRALNVYNTAIATLASALGDTSTGPVAGLMPAITSSQQISAGAIAAMGPVLKDLFRGAGEGTFTDQDQKILTDMLPSRRDTPAARAAKLQNIDAIVRAKLAPVTDEAQPGAAAPATAAQVSTAATPATTTQPIRVNF